LIEMKLDASKSLLEEGKSISDEEFLRRAMLDVVGRMPTAAEMKTFKEMPAKERREWWLSQLSDIVKSSQPPRWLGTTTCMKCHTTTFGPSVPDSHHIWMWEFHRKADSPQQELLRKAL